MATKLNSKIFLTIFFLLIIGLLSFAQLSNHDTGFHLKTGEYIIENLKIPTTDVFSYTAIGQAWVNHYWFSDVVMYLVNRILGYWGLIFFVSLVAVATYIVLYKTSKNFGSNQWSILFISALYSIFFIIIWSYWSARPQIFGFFICAFLIFILEKWRLSGNKKWLALSVPVLFVWANSHASVILGIFLVAVYIGIFLIPRIKIPSLWIKEVVWGILACVVTLANPNGLKVLTYSWNISDAVKEVGIFEWISIWSYLFSPNPQKARIVFIFMVAVLIFVLWVMFYKLRVLKKIKLRHLVLLVTAFILPLISVRHVGFFPILTFPLLTDSLDYFLVKKLAEKKYFNLIKIGIFVFGLALLVVGLWKVPSTPISEKSLPERAGNFISENKIQGPIFNTISHGSYLIWKIWPQEKVFIDGRSEVYPLEIWSDYKKIMEVGDEWKGLFNKYNFQIAILSSNVPIKEDSFVQTDIILAYKLVTEMGFKLIFWDDSTIILIKDIPANKKIISEYGYKIIGPYLAPQQIPLNQSKDAAREIKRAMEMAPFSEQISTYGAVFLKTH